MSFAGASSSGGKFVDSAFPRKPTLDGDGSYNTISRSMVIRLREAVALALRPSRSSGQLVTASTVKTSTVSRNRHRRYIDQLQGCGCSR